MAPSIGEAAQHLLASWSRDDWTAAARSVTARRVKPALIFGLAFLAMRKAAELAQEGAGRGEDLHARVHAVRHVELGARRGIEWLPRGRLEDF